MSDKMTEQQQTRYDILSPSAKRIYQHWRTMFDIAAALELAEASFGNESEYQRLKKKYGVR